MKKLLVLLLLITACTHEKSGQIVKDSKGNLYMLKLGVANENYWLQPIDTIQLNNLK